MIKSRFSAMDYTALMRRKLLEDIYDRMSDDEKRLFVQLTLQNKTGDEILQALAQQQSQLNRIEKKQNGLNSFGSDILANFTTDTIIYLFSKLAKIHF